MNKDYTLPIIVTILAFVAVGLCGQLNEEIQLRKDK